MRHEQKGKTKERENEGKIRGDTCIAIQNTEIEMKGKQSRIEWQML